MHFIYTTLHSTLLMGRAVKLHMKPISLLLPDRRSKVQSCIQGTHFRDPFWTITRLIILHQKGNVDKRIWERFSSLRGEQLSKLQGEQNSWPELWKDMDAVLVGFFWKHSNIVIHLFHNLLKIKVVILFHEDSWSLSICLIKFVRFHAIRYWEYCQY